MSSFFSTLVQSALAVGAAAALVYALPGSGEGNPWAAPTGREEPLVNGMIRPYDTDLLAAGSTGEVSSRFRTADDGVEWLLPVPGEITEHPCAAEGPYRLNDAATTAQAEATITLAPEAAVSPAAEGWFAPRYSVLVLDQGIAREELGSDLDRLASNCAGQGDLSTGPVPVTAEFNPDIDVVTFYYHLDEGIVPYTMVVRSDHKHSVFVTGVNVLEADAAAVADLQLEKLDRFPGGGDDFATQLPGLAELIGTVI